MSPKTYFPSQYLLDLATFANSQAVPSSGPFWMLCGMTAGNLFEPDKRRQFIGPTEFLCCSYALNLLDQGIYQYFPHLHKAWRSHVAPFVDIRGCHHGHGGWTHRPSSIIVFAEDPSYIPRAKPIEIRADLPSYITYFLYEYAPSILSSATADSFDPSMLLRQLQLDPDCIELCNIAIPSVGGT